MIIDNKQKNLIELKNWFFIISKNIMPDIIFRLYHTISHVPNSVNSTTPHLMFAFIYSIQVQCNTTEAGLTTMNTCPTDVLCFNITELGLTYQGCAIWDTKVVCDEFCSTACDQKNGTFLEYHTILYQGEEEATTSTTYTNAYVCNGAIGLSPTALKVVLGVVLGGGGLIILIVIICCCCCCKKCCKKNKAKNVQMTGGN